MVFLLPLLLSFLFAQQQPAVGPTSLVLTRVTVIDATGAAAKPDLTVIITGNHISKIGKSDAIGVPMHAQVVDATNKFLIPGLWTCMCIGTNRTTCRYSLPME
jgi:hypothetical protein